MRMRQHGVFVYNAHKHIDTRTKCAIKLIANKLLNWENHSLQLEQRSSNRDTGVFGKIKEHSRIVCSNFRANTCTAVLTCIAVSFAAYYVAACFVASTNITTAVRAPILVFGIAVCRCFVCCMRQYSYWYFYLYHRLLNPCPCACLFLRLHRYAYCSLYPYCRLPRVTFWLPDFLTLTENSRWAGNRERLNNVSRWNLQNVPSF